MKNNLFIRLIVIIKIYILLNYFGGEIGHKIMYPINLLVTYLHEFGHALGALITGGAVERIQVNADGSGFTMTAGGNRSVILMGGYIGSAVLGNMLFYIGSRSGQLVKPFMLILASSMIFTSVYWYNSMFTTLFLLAFGAVMILLAMKTNFGDEILMFLGLASILYIIKDFNVGPSSDLKKYAEIMVILPVAAWMYIWLFIVLILTVINLRFVYRLVQNKQGSW